MPELLATAVGKRFGLRTIFSGISFGLERGDILAITGRNGSGKSTLLKILANITEISEGKIEHRLDGTVLSQELLPRHLGFVSPYLQLYTEFTAWEHIQLVQKLRGLELNEELALELLERFAIADRRHDVLRTFSSGMMQRVKYTCALVHSPPFLLLDEPRTNLDRAGIDMVYRLIEERGAERITLIATNDPEDVEQCTALLSVEGGVHAASSVR